MNHRNIFFLVFAMLALSACTVAQSAPGTDKARFEAAAAYSREHRGVGVMVMKGDTIVFEDFPTSAGKDLPWILASGTKSFSGVMCAAAIEDKLISGFDEKAADTITEWKGDARKSKITIRQLLSLTSGIEAGQIGIVPSYADAVTRPANYEPGTHFEYGPVPFQIFGEIMTRKLKARGETVDGYLKRRILEPIGLSVSFWRKNGGQPLLPQGATLTAREWIKLGKLLKDRGKWNGKQIVAAKLLDELVVGSKANPAYGLTFWLNAKGLGPGGGERANLAGTGAGDKLTGEPLDIFMAAGAGNQRLYVIRSHDLVVVRFGAFGDFDDREFVSRLLTGK